MKLLIIITPFSPFQTPNTLRWISLIEYFQTKGIEISVLTTELKSKIHFEKENQDHKIYRAGYNTLLDWVQDKLSFNKRRGIPGENQPLQTSTTKYPVIEKLIDLTWRKNYWPDGSQLFLKPGIKKGTEIITEQDITHVISVGLPFTCHWIAYHLKEKFPRIHWHQDIEDPFSYSDVFWVNNFKKYKQKNILAESKAFQLSDSISVTNHRAMKKYQNLFPDSSHKLSVIHPLFSDKKQKDFAGLDIDKKKLHLGYFGTFYTDIRSPEPFLNMLLLINESYPEKLSNLHFHFFGLQNKFSSPIFEKFNNLKSSFKLYGLYDRDSSMDAMRKMDFLLNFGNSTDYHLPSKVVDYLYSNKPIVNVHSIKNDSSKEFFKDHKDILNLNTTDDQLVKLANSFIEFVTKERETAHPDISKVEAYNAKNIGNQYLDKMN